LQALEAEAAPAARPTVAPPLLPPGLAASAPQQRPRPQAAQQAPEAILQAALPEVAFRGRHRIQAYQEGDWEERRAEVHRVLKTLDTAVRLLAVVRLLQRLWAAVAELRKTGRRLQTPREDAERHPMPKHLVLAQEPPVPRFGQAIAQQQPRVESVPSMVVADADREKLDPMLLLVKGPRQGSELESESGAVLRAVFLERHLPKTLLAYRPPARCHRPLRLRQRPVNASLEAQPHFLRQTRRLLRHLCNMSQQYPQMLQAPQQQRHQSQWLQLHHRTDRQLQLPQRMHQRSQ